MAEGKLELMEWLSSLNDSDMIGVDDEGLCLRAVGNEDIYYEIGGLPEDNFTPTNLAASDVTADNYRKIGGTPWQQKNPSSAQDKNVPNAMFIRDSSTILTVP